VQPNTWLVTTALCAIGLLISAGFTVAMVSGVGYLAIRKEAVAEIEDMYVNRDGVRVASRLSRTKAWLRSSPTAWVLRLTPAVGGLGWSGMLVYLLFFR
jgi:hypothetical protein